MSRRYLKALSLGLAAVACLLSSPAGAVTIDMVTVGNPGNANDTGGSGIGRVDYSYQIGTYSVTIGQYTAFLNATDPLAYNLTNTWNPAMESDSNIGGIQRELGMGYLAFGPNGTAYGQSGANRPITYVS
jgi:hypothetical protein